MEHVQSHFRYDKGSATAFLTGAVTDNAQSFEEVWNHFDVNKDGLVEVERMPQLLRMVCGALDIDLQ